VVPSLDRVAREWEEAPPVPRLRSRFELAGVSLDLDADEPALLEELALVLGRPRSEATETAAPFRLAASVRARGGPAGFGHLRISAADPQARGPAEILLVMGLDTEDFPFHRVEAAPPWTSLAFRGQAEPMFALRGDDCLFALVPGWRKAVSLLLLQRVMRVRRDAVFFHAGSVALRGGGLLIVGPKGAGKSTLALALATRGHGLLGDEHACYVPARHELVPFRRPVGVKPGPRARTSDAALARLGRDPDRDGMMRVPAEDLVSGSPGPVPLRAVVFLRGFAAEPRLTRLEPGREELAALQPVGSSFANAAATERVFQLVRLLARAEVWDLRPGPPDDTAALVESALALP